MNTLDGYTIALDAETGKLLWRTHLADITKGETITMAPMVVKNHVLVGDSGGEFGVRGWLAALDTGSGKVRMEGIQYWAGQRCFNWFSFQAFLHERPRDRSGSEELAA